MGGIIDVSGLVKNFGRVPALNGLDLSVGAGEIHGFLGPNGAGKSTTIRILLGMLRADAGRARLFGQDPWRRAVELHRRLAYVPSDVTLWPKLTGGETIDLLGRLRGGLNEQRRAELLQAFELDPTRKARTYSTGNRQKVALVAALACDVELLVLDEPTAGLDPLMERAFQQCVREAVARGTTVLLSSHILSEVEALCQAVTIIRDGRAVHSGSLEQMRRLTRSRVSLDADVESAALGALPAVEALGFDGRRFNFTVAHGSMAEVLAVLAGRRVRSLTVTPPSLEELFIHHYDGTGTQSTPTGGSAA